MCANTANQTVFFWSGARIPLAAGILTFRCFFFWVRGSIPPLRGCGCRTFFLACVRRSRAKKNHYDETCGGQFISEGSGSYPEGSGLFNVFFLSGARFPLCAGVGVGHFFVACVRRSQAMKNHYDETCGSQFISRRFWPLNGSVLIQCGVRVCICGLQSRGGRSIL